MFLILEILLAQLRWSLDKKRLLEIKSRSKDELSIVDDSIESLHEFGSSFDMLISGIRDVWGKDGFENNLKSIVDSVGNSMTNELNSNYEALGIEPSMQITEYDISSLADVESASELKSKIESIKSKLLQIKATIQAKQKSIQDRYTNSIKELVDISDEQKERELEVLDFMKASGFDIFPKELTDRLIHDIQSNILTIPGLNINPQNIDLKNGSFGESLALADRGLNKIAKRNMVMFINKMISTDTNTPLNVEAIASGVAIANPYYLKNQLIKADIVDSMGWKYNKIRENLKTNPTQKS